MIKVYIASPYTNGDVAVNVKLQMDVYDNLVMLGFNPFAPLWSHFQHIVHPLPYHKWCEIDLEWVKVCDCILRMGGDESKGADKEVEFAEQLGKPIFYSFETLIGYYESTCGKSENS